MNDYAMFVFLRFVQRIQMVVVAQQKSDPKFNDVRRVGEMVMALMTDPQDYKIRQHKERIDGRAE